MKAKKRRFLKWTLAICISVPFILILAGSILSNYLERIAKKEIELKNGSFSSLRVNLFTRSVQLNDVKWRSPNDSTPYSLAFKKVQVEGIGIYQLLFHNNIHVNKFQLSDGGIAFYTYPDSTHSETSDLKLFPYTIYIEKIHLQNIATTIVPHTRRQISGKIENLILSSWKFNELVDIQKEIQSNFKTISGNLTGISIDITRFYKLTISALHFGSDERSMNIDSLRLVPLYPKIEFGRAAGRQVTRFDLLIPLLELRGLNYKSIFDSALLISALKINSAIVDTFRDKRLPFIKKENVPMPMSFLGELPFQIEIDTINLITSYIAVEEIQESGTKSGTVTFENINATMKNFGNSHYINKSRYAQLNATGLLMGKGKIAAAFRFPLDNSSVYSAKGKISDFPLESLNKMLENAVHIRIESGILNELSFNFNYTDFTSKGAVEVNYENLKITGLSADKGNSINYFKTFLINTGIRNNKDEEVAENKRIGFINIERDRKRFIFNFWWKSIHDGLKSSVIHNDRIRKNIEPKK